MAHKISKWSMALAFLLALSMLAGSLSPTSFWGGLSGIFHSSGTLTSCGTALAQDQGYARLLEWIALSLVAIMVGMAWAFIGQVLSGAFGGQKYNQFVKGMIWGGIETAALLGLLTGLFGIFWDFGNQQIDKARAYAVIARNTVSFDFAMMLGANMIAGFVVNMNPYFKLPGKAYMSIGFQMAPMFKPIIDILGVSMQLIITAVVMWNAQEFLLCFIQGYMLAILLPAGFFLRGFGLNAGGNALIAISLSLYFIYPQMMIMLGQTVANQVEGELVASGIPHFWFTCLDKPICCIPSANAPEGERTIPNGKSGDHLSIDEINQGVFSTGPAAGGPGMCIYNTVLANAYRATIGLIKDSGAWAIAGGAVAIGGLKYLNISWLSAGVMLPIAMFTFYALMEMVYFVFILTMLVPIFIIFVTLTIAKEIAKVLGTEIDLSSLEKLI